MKKSLFTLLLLWQAISLHPLSRTLNPTPQDVRLSTNKIASFRPTLKTPLTDSACIVLFNSLLPPHQNHSSKNQINMWIGTKTDPALKKFASKVPNKQEAYYILISEKNIYIVGNDTRGAYYGMRTLQQLITNNQLATGEIIDFPDLPQRGVVEGFYGTPWSHEKRIRQINFYGENKLNTYIYGPKDDPYHSSPHWRLPYPAQEAIQIQELVHTAQRNHVDFVWAIHPGKDIKWDQTDRNNLLQKFEWMYQLGVKAFAVFFDDISGEGTNPEKQAELLNFLHQEFIAKKADALPLIMCPTEYNKGWSNPEKKYLETLGEKLHPSIHIMWTGNTVVADIDKPTLEWINAKIQRKAYIWWNFPVSDYVRNHMLLGPAYGNAPDISNDMSGFVSNPMEHPEASKIAIFGVANYTWNMKQYHAEESWQNAIQQLLPQHSQALTTFASHNSDLGPNGHRYRRDESVHFQPLAKQFIDNLATDRNNYSMPVSKEFTQIINACDELLNNTRSNPYLLEELHPWLLHAQKQGKLGLNVINMYLALTENKPEQFENIYTQVQNLQKEMFEIDQTYNQNPYQPGIKTGTLILQPLIDKTLTYSINKFNETYNRNLEITLLFNPNKLYTNIAQLKHQPLLQKRQSVRISPVLEYMTVTTGNMFGIEFDQTGTLESLHIDIEQNNIDAIGTIEASSDGKQWFPIRGKMNRTRWNNEEAPQNIKFVRFRITSSEPTDIKLKQFEAKLKN